MMPQKYHVITQNHKFVIYWHDGIKTLRAKVCEMLSCDDSAILSIKQL